jgi:hypothetical protein
MSEEEHRQLEPEPESLNNPFIVRTVDGRQYAGAETQADAVVLAGALFAAGHEYGGRLEIVNTANQTVVAVIQTYAA